MSKPKVAFFDFASCEGCQIELTNYGDNAFLELLNHIDIVEFREAMSEKSDAIDIAFIEGRCTRDQDLARLKSIRKRASFVIAYGACAVTGGINALKNHQKFFKEYVYRDSADMPHLRSDKARPISDAIPVDFEVPGCPMDKYELLQIVSHLLHGKQPVIPNYPVCVECKRNETVCRWDCQDYCLGVLAKAGCSAKCPGDGIPCDACRGFIDSPNEASLKRILIEKAGFSAKRAENQTRMFTANLRSEI